VRSLCADFRLTHSEVPPSPMTGSSAFPSKLRAVQTSPPSMLYKLPLKPLGFKSHSTRSRSSSTRTPLSPLRSVPRYTRCCSLSSTSQYIKLGCKHSLLSHVSNAEWTTKGLSRTSRLPPRANSANSPTLAKQLYFSCIKGTTMR
jgi:hypothetical protein